MENNAVNIVQGLKFCVFDLETTGGNQKSDKIIEIGLVIVDNMKIVSEKNYLINPEIKIPDFIQKLTHISDKDVEKAPRIEEVIDEILAQMQDCILVAHNTSFDVPFFNSVLVRLGKPAQENKSLCTHLMTKYLIPGLLNSNLHYMCSIFGIPHKNAHRALDDARASAHLLLKFLHIFIDKKINKINHLYYPRNKYELDRLHLKKSDSVSEIMGHLKKLSSPYLITLKGENGITLFSLPGKSETKTAELSLIETQLKEMPWETISIRIFGPFIEALVHFGSYVSKLSPVTRALVIDFLWSQHLKNHKRIVINPDDETYMATLAVKEKNLGEFIILSHLVPEQLIIFPINSMHPQSELIFRFPGNKAKLLQFVNSRSGKPSFSKQNSGQNTIGFKDFLLQYIEVLKEKNIEAMIFSKNKVGSGQLDFLINLEKFQHNEHASFNYPAHYI
jgi:DNA polymerase-3 subunit alpha (Gram-positive type)